MKARIYKQVITRYKHKKLYIKKASAFKRRPFLFLEKNYLIFPFAAAWAAASLAIGTRKGEQET